MIFKMFLVQSIFSVLIEKNWHYNKIIEASVCNNIFTAFICNVFFFTKFSKNVENLRLFFDTSITK